jgi:hypothetical protein
MSEFETLESEAKIELGKIDIYCKLEYQKVMAILRAHFGGDHPVIADVKKLAAASGTVAPETVTAVSADTLPAANSTISGA